MCLFDAVAQLEYHGNISLEQHVVYYITAPDQACISEAIFTHIANAGVKKGQGFTQQ
jgi:hypothetical protein